MFVFQVKIYDCTPWKYFHCNISFLTYIFFTFLYENVCNVFTYFFICVEVMCWSLNIFSWLSVPFVWGFFATGRVFWGGVLVGGGAMYNFEIYIYLILWLIFHVLYFAKWLSSKLNDSFGIGIIYPFLRLFVLIIWSRLVSLLIPTPKKPKWALFNI